MINNPFARLLGHLMPAWLHWHFSKRAKWMFAAVWLRDKQTHQWMWVDEKRYYSGELQSIHSALNPQTGKVAA